MHFLLIENDSETPANVAGFLEAGGNTIHCVGRETPVLKFASCEGYDAVLVDVGVPDSDGLTLCRHLRANARRDVPLVILASRGTEADKLRGFDAGADDYLTKPFSLLELQARLKALVRRTRELRGVLHVHDLAFDLQTLLIRRGARDITLPPTGMRILEQLMRASPGAITRKQIERTVWGDDPPGTQAALRGHILIIRNAVDAEGELKLLHTVHGVGYRLSARAW
jgi:DNA-binding response OmpR family regulator